ncbi:ribosome maturation protein RimP [Piscirickettsia salmonis]|uniref:Ribosome maturation factor RimP n=1 Tax=Piscirickettsia salmonis TaxID=1238 RepID=A0A095CGE2_PISSA|nr:ribosome maturation factor RimP [Piscirickettsia salmonis]RNC79071.1 ribosome maturation factor RimP [Piscirickettsiaceae bacterium NZ-RLO2]AKP72445.1 ribosome maturation protein RimP [Piscirickettsia salmonis LF-89 = ATCC VR-1361]ALA23718.1 ribosome maturation protein RimP [Piscirickettsia salmonis]ALB24094.1 ribosome maturation protein RimP [Piscirickettsia salmonis]ALY03906.1 ribosome maturation factor RimP [Piscirickettsia salmonis]
MKHNESLTEMLSLVVTGLGFELWGIEQVPQGAQSVLRVYIEGPEGVTVEDCATVSRQIGAVLDVEDPIAGNYSLEVSSPGLDRLLFTSEQYQRYLEQELQIRLKILNNGKRRIRGRLTAVTEQGVCIDVKDEQFDIRWADIDRANVFTKF